MSLETTLHIIDTDNTDWRPTIPQIKVLLDMLRMEDVSIVGYRRALVLGDYDNILSPLFDVTVDSIGDTVAFLQQLEAKPRQKVRSLTVITFYNEWIKSFETACSHIPEMIKGDFSPDAICIVIGDNVIEDDNDNCYKQMFDIRVAGQGSTFNDESFIEEIKKIPAIINIINTLSQISLGTINIVISST